MIREGGSECEVDVHNHYACILEISTRAIECSICNKKKSNLDHVCSAVAVIKEIVQYFIAIVQKVGSYRDRSTGGVHAPVSSLF